MRVRQNDTVQVISGRDAGKRGKVQQVIPRDSRVMVEGLNIVKRHQRATAGCAFAPSPPRGVLLHILEDVPPFAGPDGTLRLRKEDLVTLPVPMAKVLVERGKARIVNVAP